MAKILVVDDDAAIVGLLRMRLVAEGHQVIVAMDASGGMMLAAREKPDLITLDFQMPAGDGAKVRERLRANTFTAKTKIIFITGMSQYDIEHAVPDDPDIRFLTKPIDMDQLKKLIAELLGTAPAAPAPQAAASAPSPATPAAPAAPKPPENLDGGALGGDILKLDV